MNTETMNSISLAPFAEAKGQFAPAEPRLGIMEARFWSKQDAIYALRGAQGGSVGEKRASPIAIALLACANTAPISAISSSNRF